VSPINLARGTVSAEQPATGYSNRQIDPNDYGAQLGRALEQAGAELRAEEDRRKKELEAQNKQLRKFEVAKRFAEEGLAAQQDMQKRIEEAPLGAPKFTEQLLSDYEKRHKGILDELRAAGYEEEVINEMDLNLTGMRSSLHGEGYKFESTSRVAKVREDLDKVGLDLSQLAGSNPAEMEAALETAYDTIDELPGLDAPLKQKLKDEQRKVIVEAAGYGLADQEPMTVLNLLTGGRWSQGRGRPLAAQDLPPEANVVLNVISGTESPGYDVMHGGSRFGSYDRHPNTPQVIRSGPNAGETSTAAGRYQDIKSTWDRIAAANGFTDFSPENQDRGNWWLAQEDYKTNTGRDLIADVRAGNFAEVRRGLASTWEGLAGISDAEFARRMMGEGTGIAATTQLIDGKTGNPVLDALDASQRRAVLSAAQTKVNQAQASYRADLDQRTENATAAYMTTGTYEGQAPTREEFYQAYAPNVAEQKWKAFEGAQHTGAFVQDMKTMSGDAIAEQLAEMMPKNTASPTYAQELRNFEAAQTAAKNTLAQREQDAAGYVVRNYPAAKDAWAAVSQGQAPMSQAFAQMQAGYEQLGIPPHQRMAWPEDVAAKQVARYAAMTPEQKIGFVTGLRQEAGNLYPAALKQLEKNGLPAEAYLSALVTMSPESAPVAANALRGLQLMEQDPTRKPKEEGMRMTFQEQLGASQMYLDGNYTAGIYRAAMGLYVAKGGNPDVAYTGNDLYKQSLQEVLGAPIVSGPSVNSIPTLLPPGSTKDDFLGFKEAVTDEDLLRLSRNNSSPMYATGEKATASDIADEGTFVRIGPSSYTIVMESDGQPLLDASGQRYMLWLDSKTVKDIAGEAEAIRQTMDRLGATIGGMVEPGNGTEKLNEAGAAIGSMLTPKEGAGSATTPFPGAEKLTTVERAFVGIVESGLNMGALGTPSRLFMEMVKGRRDPITEADFSQEEQEGFKKLVLKHAAGKASGRIDYKDYLGSDVDKNILGGFGYKIEGDTVYIEDIYDFKPALNSTLEDNAIIQVLGMAIKPEVLANRIGGKLMPDTGKGIQVRIKL
jgi:muramidase (phage lysozyme)